MWSAKSRTGSREIGVWFMFLRREQQAKDSFLLDLQALTLEIRQLVLPLLFPLRFFLRSLSPVQRSDWEIFCLQVPAGHMRRV